MNIHLRKFSYVNNVIPYVICRLSEPCSVNMVASCQFYGPAVDTHFCEKNKSFT